MSKNSKILGIITARGGSKGFPGKNIKPLLGKPLLAYSIEAAKSSGVFDRLIVSTEDEKIAEVARQYGCEVPFMRPKELARDDTPHLPVIQHAMQWLKENEKYEPDYVMILQPTSPLRQPFHMKEAVELIQKTGADSVMGVSEVPDNFTPTEVMRIKEDGTLQLFDGNPVYKRAVRRQDLPQCHASNGALYLFKTHLIFNKKNPNFYGEKVAPYVFDKKYAVDINTHQDWEEAEEALIKLQRQNVQES
ncbi:MAG: acylneuraminate cytidylyltransferase family protein [Patescibacteria group bacterium]